MIRTADRMGHITEEDSFQNNLLEKIYGSVAGRMMIRPLVTPVVSIAMGWLLDSRLSAAAVKPFIRFNHLDMSDYEKRKYTSYNDFFKRKIREGARHIDMEPGHFISPCDCRVSVYPADEKARLHIKQTEYTIEELLRNPSLGKRISGWLCVGASSLRSGLSQIYLSGQCGGVRTHQDPGNPAYSQPRGQRCYPIYKENSREYSLLKTENFRTVLMMEVGALFVGRIENRPRKVSVKRGDEKGNFAFGGSTIVLITEKNAVKPDEDILNNSREGIETRVLMGEKIGESF